MKFNFYLTLLILTLLVSGDALADRRYFGRSYMANTLPQGALEFELWNTGRFGKYEGYYYRFQPRFEFEYGITDKLTGSFYMNFDQITAEDNNFSSTGLGYSSSSIELKYRFTNPGETFIDPALYFEFSYGGTEVEYESKAIFSRRIGNNFVAALNFTSELEREVIDAELESEFEITAGLMYEFTPSIALGLEFRNHRGYEDFYEKLDNQASFIGPTINIQTNKFYLTVNMLAQVSGSPASTKSLDLVGHEKYELRTILGISL